MTRKATQADAPATEPKPTPEQVDALEQEHIASAVAFLEAHGYRVRPPAKGRQPRPDRVYAKIEDLRAWADDVIKTHGSQTAVAKAAGLAVWGPIGAALRGRPVSQARFEHRQAAVAAAPVMPRPEKPVKANKGTPAKRSSRAKAASNAVEA